MDKMLYIGMAGAKAAQAAQAITANNLANASTPGFRGDFNTLLSQQVQGAGLPTRVNSVSSGSVSNLAQGTLQSTGNPLDVAVNGNGYMAVQAADGSEAYTRRGDLRLDSSGLLVNGAGQAVLGDGGPVTVPAHDSMTIGTDGTVSIVPTGQAASTLTVVGRIRLVTLDASQVTKGQDGLFRQKNGQAGQDSADITLSSGSLESSNVSPVDAMVSMMNISRDYDMQVKMMATAKSVADSGSSVMQLQ